MNLEQVLLAWEIKWTKVEFHLPKTSFLFNPFFAKIFFFSQFSQKVRLRIQLYTTRKIQTYTCMNNFLTNNFQASWTDIFRTMLLKADTYLYHATQPNHVSFPLTNVPTNQSKVLHHLRLVSNVSHVESLFINHAKTN